MAEYISVETLLPLIENQELIVFGFEDYPYVVFLKIEWTTMNYEECYEYLQRKLDFAKHSNGINCTVLLDFKLGMSSKGR